jgi:bile acid:Na+ symporter, BASS family
MTSNLIPQLLLIALALVMLGLGLSLRLEDFTRLRHHPKAVVIALLLQVLVLPAVCWSLVKFMQVSPMYAVGMMVLAASPGGVTANLFSHLFGGNVAMNISLTAINTVLSIVTLPLISNWAIAEFAAGTPLVPLQFGKLLEVMAVVLVPVMLGMWVNHTKPALSALLERPMKIFSILVLVVFALGAISSEWTAMVKSFTEIGLAVVVFNVVSLLMGYYVSRFTGLEHSISAAISFEIGIHNATLAIFIAAGVLGSTAIALPAALYSVSMYVTSTLFGFLILRRGAAPVNP